MTTSRGQQFSAVESIDGGELRLPKQPGVIRLYWARHPRLADTLLAVLWGMIAASGIIDGHSTETVRTTVIVLPLVVVSVAGIYLRRTHPLLAVALSGAAVIASIWAPGDIVLAPAVFAVYSVPVHRSAKAGWIAAAIIEVAGVAAAVIGRIIAAPTGINPFNPGANVVASVPASLAVFAIQFGVALALALLVGINVGNRRRYLTALIDRARQLAIERDQQAQLAAAAERSRIAREMHDIVSHSLTVMVTLAEGSAMAAENTAPEAADAMRKAADTGRTAMVDMRRMLGVLGGDPEAELAPQPGYADLSELIDRFRSLGLPITYRRVGPAPADPAIQLAVYRLVQEALTNTLRYAHGPDNVRVHIANEDGILRASVTDNGLSGFPKAPAGTGRGLIGLRERLTTLGGELAAGPLDDSAGWSVQAALPLQDADSDGNTG